MRELRASAGFWLRNKMDLPGPAVTRYLYLLQLISGWQLLHCRRGLSFYVAARKSLLLPILDHPGLAALQLLHKQLSFLWTFVQREAESKMWGRVAMGALSGSLYIMKKPGQGMKLDFMILLSSFPCHSVSLKVTFLFTLNSVHLCYLYQLPS